MPGSESKTSLIDRLLCSCGSNEFHWDVGDTSAVPKEREQGAPNRVRCKCGRSWPVIDGIPAFADMVLTVDHFRKIRVVQTDPGNDPRWEPFVSGQPNATIYHHAPWISALEAEYGQTGIHLACESIDGELLAILPLLQTRGLPFNLGGLLTTRRLSSLPRTPIAGPLSSDRFATDALLKAAIRRAHDAGGLQLQLKTQSPEFDGIVSGLAWTSWRPSYILDIRQFSGVAFRVPNSHARATIKWAINKATRLGVRVRAADSESDLRKWYKLYLEAMRRNAVLARSYRFFRSLWDLLRPKGMMELLIAERQEETGRTTMLAGSIFLMSDNTVSYAFNGSRRKYLSLRPNDVIQWRAINDACMRGFQVFDFGEVAEEHSDLAIFKSKWGAQPTRLHRYYYPVPIESQVGLTVLKSKPRHVAEAIWRLIPLRATAWLSDLIYRFL
jgi:hypothetical protein